MTAPTAHVYCPETNISPVRARKCFLFLKIIDLDLKLSDET